MIMGEALSTCLFLSCHFFKNFNPKTINRLDLVLAIENISSLLWEMLVSKSSKDQKMYHEL